ncbi:MAG: DUF222 domain-containing protein [Actinomycetales bacterium]|nr:DUF222 domain-containing protein [Actinomycetales bacterium]
MDLSRHAISAPGSDPGDAGMPCAVPVAVQVAAGRPGAEVGAGPVGVVRDFVAWLAGVDGAASGGDQCAGDAFDDAARLDLIGALEAVKAAAAAAQARVTTAFAASQREVHLARGGKPQQAARSIGSQVALARRDSPSRGDQHVGFAHALHVEMPHTMAALTHGVISEYRATLIVRETACLTREQRAVVDERLAPDLPSLGNRSLAAAARRIAAQVDAAAVVARMERAVASRRVTVRPAPDGMAWLTFLAPLTEAVGAYAALDRLAKTALTTVLTGHDPQQSNPPANGSDTGLARNGGLSSDGGLGSGGGGAAVPGRGGQTRTRGQLMVDLGLDRIFGRTTSTIPGTSTSTSPDTTARPDATTRPDTSPSHGDHHRWNGDRHRNRRKRGTGRHAHPHRHTHRCSGWCPRQYRHRQRRESSGQRRDPTRDDPRHLVRWQ